MDKAISKKKIEIIAEIANTHQGDPEYALRLANKCIKSGADAVKFQIYFADELLVRNHPRYTHFKKQSFTVNKWTELFISLKNKVKIYADIFGIKAFEIANKSNLDGYKIHSSDLTNKILLDKLNDKKKKYFLSCGGSNLSEIAYAVKTLNKKNIKPILMHGFQAYPTEIADTHLNRIKLLKNIFKDNCDYGYQDHISGSDNMNMIIPQLAIPLGINFIEKHVILKRDKSRIDYYSSVEPADFSNFVKQVRCSEVALGPKNFFKSHSELKYRNEVKKFWVSGSKLKKNSIVKKSDFIMKRVHNNKKNNIFIEEIINKKLKIDLDKETVIDRSFFENHITALIIVRTKSKRLPKKCLKKICGITTIEHCISRVKQSKKIDKIILCTTNNEEDKVLIEIAKKNKIQFHAGENENVLLRMLNALKKQKTDLVIRITGDDILIDPVHLDKTIDYHLKNNNEYTDNKALPSGTEVEIFNKKLLEKIFFLANDSSGTEYLTFYIKNNQNQISTGSLPLDIKIPKKIKLTLDTKKDFKKINFFLNEMKKQNKLFSYSLNDIIIFYNKNKNKFNNEKKKIKGLSVDTNLQWKKILKFQN